MSIADFIENVENKEETVAFEAYGSIVEQLQASLNRYCLSITGSSWDAEDLAQDTWLKAIATLRDCRHQNPEALLLRIAKNTWIDQSRRKNVWALIMRQQSPNVTLPDYGALVIESAFQALFRHLSPLQRTVFLLRDVCGYSIHEAARLLSTTEGAVKAALFRARHALGAVKKELEEGAAGAPSIAGDEGLKSFLRTIAAAYQMGDIAALVELAQRDEVEPAMAIGIAQTRMLRKSNAVQSKKIPSQVQSNLRMAA
jgi:RNA polymerase sigma-70 factor (ECF subfamily)